MGHDLSMCCFLTKNLPNWKSFLRVTEPEYQILKSYKKIEYKKIHRKMSDLLVNSK